MQEFSLDRTCRYLMKAESPGVMAYLLGTGRFARWRDTKEVPYPSSPGLICDTVAEMIDDTRGGLPWAVIVEVQSAPDPRMFGRLVQYAANLWLGIYANDELFDRYEIGAVVINLTGIGRSGRTMEWAEAGLSFALRPREINLETEDALATLERIAQGEITKMILPWVTRMQGAEEEAVVDRWLEVARSETNAQKRSDYGALARIFVEGRPVEPLWSQRLKGWNMAESKYVTQWIAQGKTEGKIEGKIEGKVENSHTNLLQILTRRFGIVPSHVSSLIQAETELPVLTTWVDLALEANSVDDFLQAISPQP